MDQAILMATAIADKYRAILSAASASRVGLPRVRLAMGVGPGPGTRPLRQYVYTGDEFSAAKLEEKHLRAGLDALEAQRNRTKQGLLSAMQAYALAMEADHPLVEFGLHWIAIETIARLGRSSPEPGDPLRRVFIGAGDPREELYREAKKLRDDNFHANVDIDDLTSRASRLISRIRRVSRSAIGEQLQRPWQSEKEPVKALESFTTLDTDFDFGPDFELRICGDLPYIETKVKPDLPKQGDDSTIQIGFTLECAFRVVPGVTATHKVVQTMHAERLDPLRSTAFVTKGGVIDDPPTEPEAERGGLP